MDQSKIQNVMSRFSFNQTGFLQYWEYIQVGYEWKLRVANQLFVSSQNKKEGLKNYRKRCLGYGYVSVGPDIQVDQELLAALAAQKRDAAYQRTSLDRDQILGQLVVPVFDYQGGEIFAGVMELVTFRPKESYETEFKQMKNLLESENLATKPLANTIM